MRPTVSLPSTVTVDPSPQPCCSRAWHTQARKRRLVKGPLSGVRKQVNRMLRRRRLELVLPRQRGAGAVTHTRIHRFSLPPEVDATWGSAGPDTVIVDLHRMVNRARFRYGSNTWHPFVAALQQTLAEPDRPYTDTVLARFYERFQPASVHDVLLDGRIPPGVVATWPAVDYLLDVWSATHRTVQDIRDRYLRRGKVWPSQFMGPNTVPHGRDHLERVQLIHASVRDTGYRPCDFADGVATGYFLVDGQDYRFVVGHGNHRMAALTMRGVARVPVRLRPPHPPVIARDDLRRWTLQGGGLYSHEEATALFDSYFVDDGLKRAENLGLI